MKFNLPSFLSCLINGLITKRERFVLGITSLTLLKKHSNGFVKKYPHLCLVKTFMEIGQKIYDVDKKSESSFKTCCPLTFLNKFLSPYKILIKL